MGAMNPEERFERIERKLEFMAEIQAQLLASQQRQDAEIAQLANVVSDLARVVDNLGNRMENGFRRVDEHLMRISEHLTRTDEHLNRTDEHIRRTDDRLNVLIGVVERYFSDGRH